MTVSQVEAFRAVVLSGSTTGAARLLHTSQPNVSRLISQLEKSIGLKLFERSPGKLTLTDEGLTFYNEVQRSFVGLEQLDETAEKLRRFGTGLLRIAAVSTLALGLLPRAIKRFSIKHPEVGLSIHMGHSTVISQWVDSHYCDMGIVSHLPQQNLSSEPEVLFHVNSVCLMPEGHRLAQKERITPADLEGESFISLGNQEEMRKSVDRIFDEAGVKRKITIETPYSSIINSLVALDMGVCIINPLAVQDYRQASMVTRPFEPAVVCEGLLILPKGRPRSRLVEIFSEILREVASEECAALRAK
ncbi:TPA: LysR family transcriptional regulator [Pseudomonas putida]|jgi:DNA-binding transcriptional LysR family regulator|uniref:LysR substrate-binding domain-containing protein n=1 Tax=Pseudomonas putida TaxID=303 RepID=UPI0023648BB2|nr:LysR substrate-binding domain-containing protein [Pseudomonas putida]MDD2008327.1 LysR substrate-binding domain-containing protein [Pseudomonas putida]HDS1775792.1 LysR family transcriptional regulator [Pseudomonas putida]